MADKANHYLTERIIDFLADIGLEVTRTEIHQPTVLPGISVVNGVILIDESRLIYPGDLLHEAGHLAVIPAQNRKQAGANVGRKASDEMMAIAWSYAASVHLGLEPSVVFHQDGYRGGSKAIIENFTDGRYVGVSTLQWIGLTTDQKQAREMGIRPYPNMIKWVLE